MRLSPVAYATSAALLLAMNCAPSEDSGVQTAVWVGSGDDPAIRSSALGELTSHGGRVVDLTVLLAETLPAHWGSNPPFARWTNNWFEQPEKKRIRLVGGTEQWAVLLPALRP